LEVEGTQPKQIYTFAGKSPLTGLKMVLFEYMRDKCRVTT